MYKIFNKTKTFLLLITVIVLFTGCAAKQSRRVEKSGFLGNYTELKKGNSNEALYVYENPSIKCNTYNKVIIDPVLLWAKGDNSDLATLNPKDKKMLLTIAWGTLYDAMEKGQFKIVQESGPDVLRVRGAITEASKANVLLADILAVAPYAWMASTVWGMGTGKWPFLGELSGEVEILDSETGERLFAGVDKVVGRLGGNLNPLNRWGDVVDGFQLWRDRMSERMESCRDTGSFAMPDDDRWWIEKVIDYVAP